MHLQKGGVTVLLDIAPIIRGSFFSFCNSYGMERHIFQRKQHISKNYLSTKHYLHVKYNSKYIRNATNASCRKSIIVIVPPCHHAIMSSYQNAVYSVFSTVQMPSLYCTLYSGFTELLNGSGSLLIPDPAGCPCNCLPVCLSCRLWRGPLYRMP